MRSKAEERFREKFIIEKMSNLNFTQMQIEEIAGIGYATVSRSLSKCKKMSSKYAAIESFIISKL